jgi:hypothetical protein
MVFAKGADAPLGLVRTSMANIGRLPATHGHMRLRRGRDLGRAGVASGRAGAQLLGRCDQVLAFDQFFQLARQALL